MLLRALFVFAFSFSLTAATYSEGLDDDANLTKAVQDQNAVDSNLILALNSTRSEKQSYALQTLMKILTPESLNLLVASVENIKPENFGDYCLALGQMYLVNPTTVGKEASPSAITSALTILEKAVTEKKSVAFCFEAYAKLSARSLDAKMENLFKTIRFVELTEKEIARIAMSIYYHRQNTFNPAAPTDRYLMSPTFAEYFRLQRFDASSSADVRQAFARVVYLANDSQVYSDYARLVNDSDFTTRYLAVDLVNYVDKKNRDALLAALKDSDYRIVVRALDGLKNLGLVDGLLALHPEFLSHARRQVRRSMLQTVGHQLSLDQIKNFLKDESLAVRQIAAAEVITRSETREDFAQEVISGFDLAAKKGIIDASAALQSRQATFLLKAIDDSDFNVRSYALTYVLENNIEAAYPRAIEFLGAATLDERSTAASILLNWIGYPERLKLLERVYSNSWTPMFYYLRETIANGLMNSKDAADHQLLLKLLPIERNWRIANQIGQALLKLGLLSEYSMREPTWEDAAGSKYVVNQTRPRIEMQTTKGKMVFELYNDLAPLHVSEVLWGIKQGFWDKNYFHRVIDNFVAQSYRPTNVFSVPNADVRAEIAGLKQERGTIAMPRSDYLHTGDGGGFYINLITNWNLNYNYTVFGKIVDGDSTLDELEIGDQVLSVRRIL